MKKISLMLVAFLLVFQLSVFAEEEKTLESSTDNIELKVEMTEPSIITYEEAKEKLIESNQKLKTIEEKIEIQKIIIEEVDKESSRLKDAIYQNEDKINERATSVYVDPIDARNTLNTLNRSYEDTKFELEQSVLDFYVKYVTLENNLQVLETVKQIQEEEYRQKSLALELGQITTNDLRSYQLALDTATTDLENTMRNKELMLVDFNYLITDSLELQFIPDINDLESILVSDYIPLEQIELDYLKEQNLKFDNTLLNYEEEVEKIKAQKKVEQLDPSTVSAFENYNASIEDNDFETNKRIKEIKYQVQIDYNNLKALALDIKINQNKVEITENTVKNVTAQEENGMATKLDLIKAQKELTASKNALTETLNNYYKAYHDFMRFY